MRFSSTSSIFRYGVSLITLDYRLIISFGQSPTLSIPRSKLIEVSYTLRVSLSAGPLTTDISVALPIKIVNFLSLDPPATCCTIPMHSSHSTSLEINQSTHSGLFTSKELGNSHSPIQGLTALSMSRSCISIHTSLSDINEASEARSSGSSLSSSDNTCNISLSEDTDDVVQYAVSGYDCVPDEAPRSMYHQASDLSHPSNRTVAPSTWEQEVAHPMDETMEEASARVMPSNHTFAARVQEKMAARHHDSDVLDDHSSGSRKSLTTTASNPTLRGPRALNPDPQLSGLPPSPSSRILPTPPSASSSVYMNSLAQDSSFHSSNSMETTPTLNQSAALAPSQPFSSIEPAGAPGTAQVPMIVRRVSVIDQPRSSYAQEVRPAPMTASAPVSRRNSTVGPAQSVKDKIKELEQKLKALDG